MEKILKIVGVLYIICEVVLTVAKRFVPTTETDKGGNNEIK